MCMDRFEAVSGSMFRVAHALPKCSIAWHHSGALRPGSGTCPGRPIQDSGPIEARHSESSGVGQDVHCRKVFFVHMVLVIVLSFP